MMKKSRVVIALLPILILICVPIQNQNLLEEETNDSVSQRLRLQRIEDLEIADFIEKEKQVDFDSSSLDESSNSENKPQKTGLLEEKGINKAINSIQGVTAYNESVPIEILNNSAFGPTGYNFTGNGQSDNPYQITGYNITDSSATLIHIEDTNVHFRIANNYLNGSDYSYDGIYFEDVANGFIENNTIVNNANGISLDSSENITIFNNSIYDHNIDGVRLFSFSSKMNITKNKIFNCGRGISLSSSDNNTLWNNTIHDSSYTGDISIYSSNSNEVVNNTLYDSYNGITLESSSRYNNITGNTILNVKETPGSGIGIIIDSSHNNTLLDNKIFNCSQKGINLDQSHNNTIQNNDIIKCATQGIYLWSSNDNSIENNKISNCTISQGISFFNSHNNSISLNVIYYCAYGIYVYSSSDNTLFSNNISKNYNYGLAIDNTSTPSASNNLVEWNIFIGNNNGNPQVYVATYTSGNTLRYNYYDDHTSTDTNNDGFFDTPYYAQPSPSTDRIDPYPRAYPYMYHAPISITNNANFTSYNFPGNGSKDNPYIICNYYFANTSNRVLIYINNTNVYFRVENNVITGLNQNSRCIQLDNVENGVIDGNIICNNTNGVIYFSGSKYNNISNNFIHSALSDSIMLVSYSDNNTIHNNNIHDIEGGGIWLGTYSSYNILSNNTIDNCRDGGFQLWGATIGNTIQNNSISSCNLGGIRLVTAATDNYILDNVIDNCHDAGLQIYSDDNFIVNNMISNCTYCVHLSGSDSNKFYNNTFYNVVDSYIIFLDSSHNNIFIGNNITKGYDYAYGVYMTDSDQNTFVENTIYDCDGGGINVLRSNFNNFTSNTIFDCPNSVGIDLNIAHNNTLTKNVIYNCSYGTIISVSSNNSISYNNIFNNSKYAFAIATPGEYSIAENNTVNWNNFMNSGYTPQAYDNGDKNNVSYNYWDDHTGPDNSPPDGIVDTPYALDGGSGNEDLFPLTKLVLLTVIIQSPISQNYGVDTITVTLSGDAIHYWYYITGDADNQTWTINEVRTLADGTYILHAYGNDTLGNTAHVSVSFTIDTTPPVVSITNPIGSTIYNQNNFTLSYTVSDGTVTIYLNGYANTTAIPSGTIVTDVPDGSYNLTIISVDQAGNIGKVTILGTIDTPPSSSSSTTSSSTTSSSTTPKKGSFPGIFTLVIFFTLPLVIFRRYRKFKKI